MHTCIGSADALIVGIHDERISGALSKTCYFIVTVVKETFRETVVFVFHGNYYTVCAPVRNAVLVLIHIGTRIIGAHGLAFVILDDSLARSTFVAAVAPSGAETCAYSRVVALV